MFLSRIEGANNSSTLLLPESLLQGSALDGLIRARRLMADLEWDDLHTASFDADQFSSLRIRRSLLLRIASGYRRSCKRLALRLCY